jgi:hypothetical protein
MNVQDQLDPAYAERLRGLASMPAARPAATLGEIFSTEWERSGLGTVEGVGQPLNDARREFLERLETVTGKSLDDLQQETGVALFRAGGHRGASDAAVSLVGRLPEEQRKQLEPFADILGNARRKAREIEQRASDVGSATYGLSGYATNFAAGVARQMASPVNIALMPLGGPLSGAGVRGVAGMLAREAGYGMLGQAVQEPFIAAGRAELGLENNSLENILQAGVGQAAFAGVLRAGAEGLRAINRMQAERRVEVELRDAVPMIPENRIVVDARTGEEAPVMPSGRPEFLPRPDPGTVALPDGRIVAPAAPRTTEAAPAELRARADAVGFSPIRQAEGPEAERLAFGRAPTEDDLPAPLRDVASRMEPEDLEALAMLAERNHAMDVQASLIGSADQRLVRDLTTDDLMAVPAVAPDTVEPVARLFRRGSSQSVADAAKQLEDAIAAEAAVSLEDGVAARRRAVNAVQAGHDAISAAAPRFVGEYPALSISDFQAVKALDLSGELANILSLDLLKATSAAERAALRARADQIIALLDRPIVGRSQEELVMLQADAIEAAGRAMEMGQPVPQPVALRSTSVRAGLDLFQPATAFDLVVRGRPDVGEAVAAARAGADNAFARAFHADDAMTVRVPDEVALSRVVRAAERAASAEANGAPRWPADSIARLAGRIDTPAGTRAPVADRPPRQAESVRVRAKADQPSPGGNDSSGLPRSALLEAQALTPRQQRLVARVEADLAAIGDTRVTVMLADGREITSARALLGRAADDEAAVRELQACMAPASGTPS